MSVPPLINFGGKDALRARGLASEGTSHLALLWLLCFAVPSWAATLAPVTVVDVMVLYTPQARAGAGNAATIEAQIDLAAAEANLVFENSRANVRIHLVHKGELAYAESGSVATDLARLRSPNDGWLDAAHGLRNQHAADLVCLVTETGGDYWFNGLQGPSAANAFSVIRRRYLTGDYYFPVVLSFNFGCQLERPYADSVGAFPYSYGYTAQTDFDWFSSVEAFDGNRLPYFSNPDILLGGTNDIPSFRLGVPAGLPGAANNTKTLNLTAQVVAGFRGAATQTLPPKVRLIEPPLTLTNSIEANAGTNLLLGAEVSDSDGSANGVTFFERDQRTSMLRLIGGAANRPFSFVWTNVPAGRHDVFAQGVDDLGATAASTNVLALNVHSVPPANDNFANATVLQGNAISIAGDNTLATTESGELNWADGSVWYSWTAPQHGRLTVSVPESDFETVFGVVTGDAVSNLTVVAIDQDPSGGFYWRIELDVNAGVTYHIAVAGYYGDPSLFTLSLAFRPALGVHFASPQPGDRFSTTNVVTIAAEATAVQPAHVARVEFLDNGVVIGVVSNAPFAIEQSIMTAGEHSLMANVFDDHGAAQSSVPLRIVVEPAVYLQLTSPQPGEVVSSTGAVLIAAAVTAVEPTHVAAVEFLENGNRIGIVSNAPFSIAWTRLVPGPHSLVAKAYDDQGASKASAPIQITVALANDDFARRTAVIGTSASVLGSTATATSEAGEPAPTGISDGKSVWFSWTAPASGPARVMVWGLTFWPVCGIYSGTSVNNLHEIVADYSHFGNPIVLIFDAAAGTEYEVFVSGMSLSGPGEFKLDIDLTMPPTNDAFVNAIMLAGSALIVTAQTGVATKEAGEPNHAGNPGGRSAWWRWTAPASGIVELAVDATGFTPLVAAYSGTVLSQLIPLAGATNRAVEFRASGGTEYYIAVDGVGGSGGDLTLRLNLKMPSPNDDFANAIALTGYSLVVTGANVVASVEPGEPTHGDLPGGRSVWWSWTASSDGWLEIDPRYTTAFERMVAVYTGSELTNLKRIAGSSTSFFTTFGLNVRAGQVYHIAVAGVDRGAGPLSGAIELHLNETLIPSNDNFANRIPLSGTNLIVYATNLVATHELGEPQHGGDGSHSIWWRWTAPASGRATVWGLALNLDALIGVYRGDSLINLTPQGAPTYNWNPYYGGYTASVGFTVVAGTTYAIAQDTRGALGGTLGLALNFSPPLSNDSFAGRQALIGTNIEFQASNLGATAEPGEPAHAGATALQSVWYSWTAPASGVLRVGSWNSYFPSRWAAYAGNTLGTLALLSSAEASPFDLGSAMNSFAVQSGRTYQIAVDRVAASRWPNESFFTFGLTFHPQPINDDFEHAEILSGSAVVAHETTVGATRQSGEPLHSSGLGSLWWDWKPSVDGTGILDASTSSIPVNLFVYVGPTLTNLVPVAGGAPRIKFAATGGVTYHIAVEQAGEGEGGSVSLTALLSRLRMTSPTNGDEFHRPIDLRLDAGSPAEDGEFAHLEFLVNGSTMASVTSQPFSFVWSNAPIGIHTLTVRGTNVAGWLHETLPISVTIRPANDDFSARAPLPSDAEVIVHGQTFLATPELGEPYPETDSLWYAWTAPFAGRVQVYVVGSSFFKPQFGVFTGSSLAILNEIGSGPTNVMWFDVVAGEAYQLVVVGSAGPSEEFLLHLRLYPHPVNDHFDARSVLSAITPSASGSVFAASHEPNEPSQLAQAGFGSVWWSWTAPVAGRFALSVVAPGWSPLLAIYTGNTLMNLQPIAAAPASLVYFDALAGTDYALALDSTLMIDGVSSAGNYTLSLAYAPRPPNDDFTNRLAIAGPTVTVGGSIAGATVEPGEPAHAGLSGGHSVWWTWTAPDSGTVTLSANPDGFVPILAVYTGDALPGLLPITSTEASQLMFTASTGTVYQIALDSPDNSAGDFTLSLSLRVAATDFHNDHFTNRAPLAAWSASVYADNTAATTEPGESLPGGAGGRTLWWTWTAPEDTTVGVGLETSVFQGGDELPGRSGPLVSIYRGDSLSNLSLVASNSFLLRRPPHGPPLPGSQWLVLFSFAFEATGGLTYQISVDGVNGSAGQIEMHWDAHQHQPPLNDYFTNRIALNGAMVSLSGSNRFATREPNEPLHSGDPGGASVWWSWTAPVTGPARLAVSASFNPVTAVYTGVSLSTLAEVAHGGSATLFDCVAGVTYQIAVDGVGGSSGEFQLDLTATARPLNDAFAGRSVISGSSVAIDGTTEAATREPGEALHPASITGASVWYSWTAPASGDVTLTVAGWNVDQPFSVNFGSALSNLFLLARAPDESGAYIASFYAVAGLIYQIAVSDNAGEESAFTLTLNAAPPAPRLQAESSARLSDGRFALRVTGTNAQGFAIQASTDLVSWTTLTLDTLQGSVFEFVDADAAGLPHRFYRVLPLDALFSNGPLRVADPMAHPGGLFSLEVRGPAGLPFVLESSEDLEDWSRLTAGQIIGDSFGFEDGDAPAFARRFYRAIKVR